MTLTSTEIDYREELARAHAVRIATEIQRDALASELADYIEEGLLEAYEEEGEEDC